MEDGEDGGGRGVELNSLPNLINRHSPASPLRKLEMGILKSGAVYHHR